MKENMFSVEMWDDFWNYTNYWARKERNMTLWNNYWRWWFTVEAFIDIAIEEGQM